MTTLTNTPANKTGYTPELFVIAHPELLKLYLGKDKFDQRIYLYPFSWDCNWYWGGGCLGNTNLHFHFKSFNRKQNGEACNFFDGYKDCIVSDNQLTDDQLWRLCDLMRQFYAHKESAECFNYGGGYTSDGRTENEYNPELAVAINKHIEKNIIPEVYKVFGV